MDLLHGMRHNENLIQQYHNITMHGNVKLNWSQNLQHQFWVPQWKPKFQSNPIFLRKCTSIGKNEKKTRLCPLKDANNFQYVY